MLVSHIGSYIGSFDRFAYFDGVESSQSFKAVKVNDWRSLVITSTRIDRNMK